MKAVFIILLALAAVSAEYPVTRNFGRNRIFSRQVAPPSGDAPSGLYPPARGGPYPPSGWRPSGPAFTLPPRQQASTPSIDYGTPSPTYGAPTTPLPQPESSEPEAENVDASGSEQSGKLKEQDPKQQQPAKTVQPLVVLLPQNQLQYQKLVLAPQVFPQALQYFGKIESPLGTPLVYTSQYYQLF